MCVNRCRNDGRRIHTEHNRHVEYRRNRRRGALWTALLPALHLQGSLGDAEPAATRREQRLRGARANRRHALLRHETRRQQEQIQTAATLEVCSLNARQNVKYL